MGLFGACDSGIGTARDVTGDPAALETWMDTKFSLRAVYLRSPSLRWVMHPLAMRLLSRLKSTAGEPLYTLPDRPATRTASAVSRSSCPTTPRPEPPGPSRRATASRSSATC